MADTRFSSAFDRSRRVDVSDENLDPWNVQWFTRLPDAVRVMGLSHIALILYVTLCWRWRLNADGPAVGITAASIRDLSRESGLSIQEVRTAIKQIETTDYVRVIKDKSSVTVFVARQIPKAMIHDAEVMKRNMRDRSREFSPALIESIRRSAR